MQNQKLLESIFKPYISKCRAGDWEHAKRVVAWAIELGKDREDLDILIIAAYIHDIGWSGIVPTNVKLTREELLKFQPQADKQTDSLVKEAILTLDLDKKDFEKILRLIKATETYEAKESDEEILVDADNLSKTDPNHVKEKYQKSDWLKMCDVFEEKLPERIKTEIGKKLFPNKLKELRLKLQAEL